MVKSKPPRWADQLLATLCTPHLLEEIQGDLHERYGRDVARVGVAKADRRYILNALKVLLGL